MGNRRIFMKQSALVGAGIAISPHLSFAGNLEGSDNPLKIGLIGVGLRGTNHLQNILYRNDCVITAICDIDERRNGIALDLIQKAGMPKPKVFGKDEYDYRNLLDLKKWRPLLLQLPGYGIPEWP